MKILGNPRNSNYFLGIPRAKRTSVLPARAFDIAAGNSGGRSGLAPQPAVDFPVAAPP